uniref:Uncharacterized protein n=1 Tax=Arundo donax TaxID=35708 RepID=A0A0A8YLP4_ARUDO
MGACTLICCRHVLVMLLRMYWSTYSYWKLIKLRIRSLQ